MLVTALISLRPTLGGSLTTVSSSHGQLFSSLRVELTEYLIVVARLTITTNYADKVTNLRVGH